MPVEALDQDFPFFRVLEYSLRPTVAVAANSAAASAS
jgi:hypothetical protein